MPNDCLRRYKFERMHKNLRLFYFLLLVTAIAAGVRYVDTQEAAEISKAANAADLP